MARARQLFQKLAAIAVVLAAGRSPEHFVIRSPVLRALGRRSVIRAPLSA